MKDNKKELLQNEIQKLKDFLSFLESKKAKRIHQTKWQKKHPKV